MQVIAGLGGKIEFDKKILLLSPDKLPLSKWYLASSQWDFTCRGSNPNAWTCHKCYAVSAPLR
jgi:hypothetical protein